MWFYILRFFWFLLDVVSFSDSSFSYIGTSLWAAHFSQMFPRLMILECGVRVHAPDRMYILLLPVSCSHHLSMTTFSWPPWDILDYINRVNSSCKPLRRINLKGNLFFLNSTKWQTSPWVPCGREDNYPSAVCVFILGNYVAVSDSVTPQTAACQASLSFTISWSLLKLTSIKSVMSSDHLILCHPLLLLPSVFPSIRVLHNELPLCFRWPNIGTSASVLPMNSQGWFPLGLTSLISLQSKGL